MKKFGIGIVVAIAASAGYCNQTGDRVAGMTEKARREFTGMLIRQTGADCPSIQRTFFQGTLDKSAVWNVACSSKENFGLVFVDDAANTIRVLKCAQVPSIGAPACFKKIK